MDSGMKGIFLKNFSESGFLLQTCERTGVSKSLVLTWLDKDPDFAKKYADANEKVTEICEATALRRAVHGIEVPVIYKGQQAQELVGYETKADGSPDKTKPILRKLFTKEYSDRLLELILKARNRGKYGDKFEFHVDEEAIASSIAARFVSIVRRVAPDVCPGCKTHLGLSEKIAEELLSLSGKVVTAKT